MEESLPANGHDESDRIPDRLLHSELQPSAQMTAGVFICATADRWATVDHSAQYAVADSLTSCPGQKVFYKGAEKQADSTENSWSLEIVHGMFTSAFLKYSLRKVSDY